MVAIQIFPRDFEWRIFGLMINPASSYSITLTVSSDTKTGVPQLTKILCALIFENEICLFVCIVLQILI